MQMGELEAVHLWIRLCAYRNPSGTITSAVMLTRPPGSRLWHLLHRWQGCEPECSLQVGPSCASGQNLWSLVRTLCASSSLWKRGELHPGFDSCQAAQAPPCSLSHRCWHCLPPMHFILKRPGLMDHVLIRN